MTPYDIRLPRIVHKQSRESGGHNKVASRPWKESIVAQVTDSGRALFRRLNFLVQRDHPHPAIPQV